MINLLILFFLLNLFFGILGFVFRLSWQIVRLILGLLMGIGTYFLVFVFAVPLLVVAPIILLIVLLVRGLFRIFL